MQKLIVKKQKKKHFPKKCLFFVFVNGTKAVICNNVISHIFSIEAKVILHCLCAMFKFKFSLCGPPQL